MERFLGKQDQPSNVSKYFRMLAILIGCLQYVAAYPEEVVIVGGGVSGLAAAYHLCRNKLCNVTVLEAEDRVGGRLFTDDFHGTITEQGAQWMHGVTGNPVYRLVSRNYEVEVDLWSDGGTIKLSSGIQPTREIESLASLAEDLWGDLTSKLSSVKRRTTLKDTVLYGEAKKLWQEKLAARNTSVASTITDAIFHYTMTEWSLDAGELTHNVSALQLSYYRELEGGDIIIPRGYSVLLDILQKDIPKAAIHLAKNVNKIVWDNDDGNTRTNTNSSKVTVVYTERDGSSGQIAADHVIVTTSVAVLQKYHRQMFVPNFPKTKVKAVEKLALGVVNKIFLHYERKFWAESSFPMQLLWDSDIQEEFVQDGHWYQHIDLIERYGESMLMVWANAYVSKKVLHLPNEEIGRRITVLFRKCMGNESIPYPDDLLVTRWHANEHFLGSYSYKILGQSNLQRRIVSKPLSVNGVPKVLFAGEAMHPTRFGTVDGAFRTGVAAAKRILAFLST